MTGCRPVVEIMFMDFMTLTLDQLVNQAAKLRYVFGDQMTCPLVVRTAGGGGKGYGPTHSQSLDAWFLHAPGLKVVAPATPADAHGMLKAAIRDPNPVIFIEHKLLYGQKGPVPVSGEGIVPFGKARLAREGTAVTIAAWSWMAHQAELAAAELAERGVSAEVLDLRSLNPLDIGSVVESVKKTRRLLLVEEGTRTGGFSAEIGFQVFEHIFDYLDAPITRLTTPDIPISASAVLERAAIPDVARIVQAALKLVS
jgi:pyruvate/2-oxoglutarate/acetoin dehydrogenase E1 component